MRPKPTPSSAARGGGTGWAEGGGGAGPGGGVGGGGGWGRLVEGGGDREALLEWFKQRLATRAYLRTVIDDLTEALGEREESDVSHSRHRPAHDQQPRRPRGG